MASLYGDEHLATEARLLLENPAFVKAVERLTADYITTWKNTPPTSSDEREALYYRARALEELQADLRAILSGGKISALNARLKQS